MDEKQPKKKGASYVAGTSARRPVRGVRSAWPFGVAGFAGGAVVIGGLAAARPDIAPCAADAPESFGDRLADGWARALEHVEPRAPQRMAGAPPPVQVTPAPPTPTSIATAPPPVEPSAEPRAVPGAARPVPPLEKPIAPAPPAPPTPPSR